MEQGSNMHMQGVLVGSKTSGQVLYLECKEDFMECLERYLHKPAGELMKELHEGKHRLKQEHRPGEHERLGAFAGLTDIYHRSKAALHLQQQQQQQTPPLQQQPLQQQQQQQQPHTGVAAGEEGGHEVSSPTAAGAGGAGAGAGAGLPSLRAGGTYIITKGMEVAESGTNNTMAVAKKEGVSMAKLENIVTSLSSFDALLLVKSSFCAQDVLNIVFGERFKAALPASFLGSLKQTCTSCSPKKAKKPPQQHHDKYYADG
eukprot:jgi/Mesen1/1039/ME000122S00041